MPNDLKGRMIEKAEWLKDRIIKKDRIIESRID